MNEKNRQEKLEIDTVVIKSQNNLLAIEQENRRLEKLFTFFRDIDENLDSNYFKTKGDVLLGENALLEKEVIDLISTRGSRFERRLSPKWDQFIVPKKINLKEE